MRTFLLLGSALLLGACGATNPNQANYDRVKAEYAAAHGDDHGGDHAAGGDASGHGADEGHAAPAGGGDGHADGGNGHADGGDGHADGGEAPLAGGERDLANGKKVYGTYCQSCHGADGKGMNGIAANLAEDRTRLAKPMDELVKNVREGYSGSIGVMPPWGAVVDDAAARDVLAYLKDRFPPE